MPREEKHCVCAEWKKQYLETINCSYSYDKRDETEVIQAQERGIRCPFCDAKLITMKRKAWALIKCSPIFVDEPDDRSVYSDAYEEYWIPLKELRKKLIEEAME